ncbi:acyltransferase family protein [Gryllotalpicola ginsengisoli]|uniref:acyltransferase family protein n=1 Tax=Gryllotalpicola ginsengisoli TaxID=444608 RepID=UPI0003F5AB98|nr:acyltransferase [Gryllotalpicola ginsengisoli]
MSSAIAPAPTRRVEFPYLDGIRGAAALMIVLYHTFLFTGMRGDAQRAMPHWAHIVLYGYLGVPLFIVLSGYVLMLPVVRTPDLWFPKGFRNFALRRARRILPPYYAAVILFSAMIWAVPLFDTPHGTQWDTKIPVNYNHVLSHLLMIHDVFADWIGKIDGPLWSVVVEWQIYFIMPLLLLPMWRHFRPWSIAVVFALLAWIAPVFHAHHWLYLHPWLLALFVMGMWAADLTMREKRPRFLGAIAAVSWLAIPAAEWAGHHYHIPEANMLEFGVGVPLAFTLAWAGRRTVERGRTPFVLEPFAARPMLRLGLVSYSVYLFHSPFIAFANLLLLPLGLSTVHQYLLLTFGVVPVVLAMCVGFFWLIERHFLNQRQRHAERELREEDRDPAASPAAAQRPGAVPAGAAHLPLAARRDAPATDV